MMLNTNLHKYLFMSMLISSTLFSISTNSWVNMWLGMEINLISFIPQMLSSNNSLTSESMMKYFLIQSLGSLNFLFVIFFKNILNKWFFTNFLNSLMIIILNLTLIMKMGAAPFHFWYPKVMKGLSWMNCFILSTWQKIIPLMILSYCLIPKLMYMSIMLSTIVGSVMGLNQSNLKMIMTYSSINHIGWLISAIMINYSLTIIYLMNYILLSYILMKFFNQMNLFHIMQIFSLKMSFLSKMLILINFISLGGIPPFLGFIPKWMIINYFMINKIYFIIFCMITMALLNLFYYLRIFFLSMMIHSFQLKWMKTKNFKFYSLLMMTYISISSLIMISFLYQMT
uniref:NADH-ubiquinone oxidoreductase chain 2 n=1 Tax=Molannodes epaphos TaxID=2904896 RepID=A0A9E8LP21_9NEOP|nr:NADH dehydrogenase subunit 2 [Molannodes epaphos]UZZ44169.1 NADH dehydrogenase subunit 2 [Molannodes epaphos]